MRLGLRRPGDKSGLCTSNQLCDLGHVRHLLSFMFSSKAFNMVIL